MKNLRQRHPLGTLLLSLALLLPGVQGGLVSGFGRTDVGMACHGGPGGCCCLKGQCHRPASVTPCCRRAAPRPADIPPVLTPPVIMPPAVARMSSLHGAGLRWLPASFLPEGLVPGVPEPVPRRLSLLAA